MINLGTNDGASAGTPEYLAAYTDLVTEAFANYGPQLHVFLACGPMSEAVSSHSATFVARVLLAHPFT